jgi:hypothetical protein
MSFSPLVVAVSRASTKSVVQVVAAGGERPEQRTQGRDRAHRIDANTTQVARLPRSDIPADLAQTRRVDL